MPSTPPPPPPPALREAVAERLSAVDADLVALTERLGRLELTLATAAELRIWGSLLAILLGVVLILVVRHSGAAG